MSKSVTLRASDPAIGFCTTPHTSTKPGLPDRPAGGGVYNAGHERERVARFTVGSVLRDAIRGAQTKGQRQTTTTFHEGAFRFSPQASPNLALAQQAQDVWECVIQGGLLDAMKRHGDMPQAVKLDVAVGPSGAGAVTIHWES